MIAAGISQMSTWLQSAATPENAATCCAGTPNRSRICHGRIQSLERCERGDQRASERSAEITTLEFTRTSIPRYRLYPSRKGGRASHPDVQRLRSGARLAQVPSEACGRSQFLTSTKSRGIPVQVLGFRPPARER